MWPDRSQWDLSAGRCSCLLAWAWLDSPANGERATQMVLSPSLLSTSLLCCVRACGSHSWETTQTVSIAVPANAVWCALCPMWQLIAAVIGEERAGGWVGRGLGNEGRCCLGTVLGTDLGKASPGCYGHGAAPRCQGGTTPWRGTVPFQGYIQTLRSWVSRQAIYLYNSIASTFSAHWLTVQLSKSQQFLVSTRGIWPCENRACPGCSGANSFQPFIQGSSAFLNWLAWKAPDES